MADNEKSSSLAATAKGTAPSTYKKYSSFPPIFQAPDQQTEEEMRLGLLYDEGNQGEVYNPDYLYGGENYPSLRILWLGGAIDSLKRGQKPPLLSFCDVFMVPGRRVLVVEKCVRHADIDSNSPYKWYKYEIAEVSKSIAVTAIDGSKSRATEMIWTNWPVLKN